MTIPTFILPKNLYENIKETAKNHKRAIDKELNRILLLALQNQNYNFIPGVTTIPDKLNHIPIARLTPQRMNEELKNIILDYHLSNEELIYALQYGLNISDKIDAGCI